MVGVLLLYVVAFELLHESPQAISQDDLAFVLHTMNQTATYFGDPAVVRKTVLSVVEDVFASKSTIDALPQEAEQQDEFTAKPDESSRPLLSNAEVAARVVEHPLVDQYVRGHLSASVSSLLHAG